jgi:two-component system cell cycle response regulator DivK
MLRLVTSNNVEIFRHLRGRTVDRLGVEHTVGTSYEEILQLVRQHRPQVVLVDLELADGSGCDLSRTVKSDPDLAGIHVILLVDSVLTRAELARIEASHCDDILALPVHSDDFCHHLAQVAGVPFRQNRRVAVTLELAVAPGGPALSGSVVNVAPGGLCFELDWGRQFQPGQALQLTLHHDGVSFPDIPVEVAWSKPVDGTDGPVQTGCRFAGKLPEPARQFVDQLTLFDICPAPADGEMAGGVTVALQGDFTELTNFAPLAARLAGESHIDFDVAAVRYISSAGVRSWCEFLTTLKERTYTFRHCSLAFTSQAAMVPMVIGRGAVLSLEAPYHCDGCDREEIRLLEIKSVVRDGGRFLPPRLRCKGCGDELSFDDIPERYFAFLTVHD